ncbi:MAG TPA: hypothetical protein VL122_06045 [Nitrospirota bacterium]|nr:hypothetical protein [Nitrospirota bacterium]
MHRRKIALLLILAAFILLTGMGGTGGFERAPRVEKNFDVTIIDTIGNKIDGGKFSWEGRIQFAGYMGMAQVTMPFERIKTISVGETRERKVRVTAMLIDGTETSFDIDAKSRCFGEASFGSFMLEMDEIKTITFKRS